MQHCFMLHSNRHKYSPWRPDMKQASVAAVHGQVFSEVRGKYTAWVYDSDMNTVYLTGFCVHTDFPLRPLSEPGCWPSEGLKAWQTCLSCFVVSFRHPICIPKKHDWLWILSKHQTVRIWVCSSVVVKALSSWCWAWCKIFILSQFSVSRERLWEEVQSY